MDLSDTQDTSRLSLQQLPPNVINEIIMQDFSNKNFQKMNFNQRKEQIPFEARTPKVKTKITQSLKKKKEHHESERKTIGSSSKKKKSNRAEKSIKTNLKPITYEHVQRFINNEFSKLRQEIKDSRRRQDQQLRQEIRDSRIRQDKQIIAMIEDFKERIQQNLRRRS